MSKTTIWAAYEHEHHCCEWESGHGIEVEDEHVDAVVKALKEMTKGLSINVEVALSIEEIGKRLGPQPDLFSHETRDNFRVSWHQGVPSYEEL